MAVSTSFTLLGGVTEADSVLLLWILTLCLGVGERSRSLDFRLLSDLDILFLRSCGPLVRLLRLPLLLDLLCAGLHGLHGMGNLYTLNERWVLVMALVINW